MESCLPPLLRSVCRIKLPEPVKQIIQNQCSCNSWPIRVEKEHCRRERVSYFLDFYVPSAAQGHLRANHPVKILLHSSKSPSQNSSAPVQNHPVKIILHQFEITQSKFFCTSSKSPRQNSSSPKSTDKGVNQHSKDVTQTQQQRPESPTVTLTWHASKYKYINSIRGTSSTSSSTPVQNTSLNCQQNVALGRNNTVKKKGEAFKGKGGWTGMVEIRTRTENSWQWARHVLLHSDLHQPLKGRTFVRSKFQQRGP